MRNKLIIVVLGFICFNFISCTEKETKENMKESLLMQKQEIKTPKAAKKEHIITTHGDDRNDPYYWMRLSDEQKNAQNPDEHTQEVLDYLNAENDYTKQMLSHTDDFQEKLYDEIVGRISPDDSSVPYKSNDYYYISKFEDGQEYPIHSRKKGSLDTDEEIMLDVNELAKGHEYYAVGSRSVSPNNTFIAFGEDTVSRRIYTLRFKNLETGEFLSDEIPGTTGSAAWANDNKTVFYTQRDPLTLRASKIYKHILGTNSSDDELVFSEDDDTFSTFVYKTKSRKYIVIGSSHTLTQEYRVLDADTPNAPFQLFQERDLDGNLEYGISHFDDKWYIRTNLDAKNFKIMSCPINQTSKDHWKDEIAHRTDVLIEGFELFNNQMVIQERVEGITQLRVKLWSGEDHYIDMPEASHLAYISTNPDFDTNILRYGYQSMKTPSSIFDYNMESKEKTLMKQQAVLGDFDKEMYNSERVFATARDGVKVPISIVYHKDTPIDGTAPCLLYGYGSYGNSMEPYFSSTRLSLLDRGFVYAIAHIRGGEEMGRHWYEDGKKLKKKNTFNDFIDCGKFLKEQNYSAEDMLFGMGGSAGGLLIGAVINQNPDLWRGVIAAVPFVDVVTTMLDESIPLTTFEFDEWGNPKDKEYYDYMLSYSPYDNVEKKEYPAIMITTGLHDSQVQYWEPAKWIAKLRDHKTDNNPLVMYCNMETGHGGASGRFARHKETAMEYAFLLDLAGKSDIKN